MESPILSRATSEDLGTGNKHDKTADPTLLKQIGGWFAGTVLFGCGVLILIALFSANKNDPSFNRLITGENIEIQNWLGKSGAVLADVFLQTLGIATLLVPLVLAGWGWRFGRERRIPQFLWRFIVLIPILLIASFLLYDVEGNYLTTQRIGTSGSGVGAVLTSTFLQYATPDIMVFAKVAVALFVFVGFLYVVALKSTEWKWIFSKIVSGVMFVLSQSGYYLVKITQKYQQRRMIKKQQQVGTVNSSEDSAKNLADITMSASLEENRVGQENHTQEENHIQEENRIWEENSWSKPLLDESLLPKNKEDVPVQETASFGMARFEEQQQVESDEVVISRDIQEEPMMSRVLPPVQTSEQAFSSEPPPVQTSEQAFSSEPPPVQTSEQAFSSELPPVQTSEQAFSSEPPPVQTSEQEPARSTPPPQETPIKVTNVHTSVNAHSNKALSLPSFALLKNADNTVHQKLTSEEQREVSQRLVSVLQDFGVHGEIKTAPSPGPVVTLYEFEPAPGTRTRKVTDLAEDVARSMSLHSVRMSTMTGRNSIAIELPNEQRAIVKLRDVLQREEYQKSTMKLPLVLGCDIGGNAEVVDLATMPHLLIAGTTGSGKSVGLNVMILSLLYRYQPDECRFIMIDPKMLELSIYQDIPHLLSPVVTDPKKAVVALKWAVKEMEERYFMMSRVGVRNIENFNKRVKELNGEPLRRKIHKGFDDEGKAIEDEEVLSVRHFPYIVVIVDEMADLMLVAGKEIEGLIQRLAQMARAAGIHIVMATQRPSVDVVTGTIKANFPTRISFMVSSKIDSRTVLGDSGAEQLLGKGDMLLTSGGGKLRRVHGPFVEDGEVEAVCQFLRSQSSPNYERTVLEEPAGEGVGDGLSDGDAKDLLFDDAVRTIKESGKASTSFLQRQLQIGYNRAARLMDMIEAAGLVSAPDHGGKREIFIQNEGNEDRYG